MTQLEKDELLARIAKLEAQARAIEPEPVYSHMPRCLWCGGGDTIMRLNPDFTLWYCECTTLGCTGHGPLGADPQEAIQAYLKPSFCPIAEPL